MLPHERPLAHGWMPRKSPSVSEGRSGGMTVPLTSTDTWRGRRPTPTGLIRSGSLCKKLPRLMAHTMIERQAEHDHAERDVRSVSIMRSNNVNSALHALFMQGARASFLVKGDERENALGNLFRRFARATAPRPGLDLHNDGRVAALHH